jgi:hypothetical protein
VADVPEGIVLRRHRDLSGLERRNVIRWIFLAVLAIPLVLGLLNVFGQRPHTSKVSAPAASLKVYSPTTVRGGLYYESRFTIDAVEEIKEATLVLHPGWLEGMTLNTLEPAPIGEASRNGELALELGHIPAGQKYRFFLQFQVNPTNVGRRSQQVDLYDGDTKLLTVKRSITVWP